MVFTDTYISVWIMNSSSLAYDDITSLNDFATEFLETQTLAL